MSGLSREEIIVFSILASLDLVCPEVRVRNDQSCHESNNFCGDGSGDSKSDSDSESGPSVQFVESSPSSPARNDYSQDSSYCQNVHPPTRGPPPRQYSEQRYFQPVCHSPMHCTCYPWPRYQQQQCPSPSYCIQSVVVSGMGEVNGKSTNGNCGNSTGGPRGNGGNGIFPPIIGGGCGGGVIDPVKDGGGIIDPITGGGGNVPPSSIPGRNNSNGANSNGENSNGENRFEKYLDRLLGILEDTKKTRCSERAPLYVIPQACRPPTIRVKKVCRKKKKRLRCDPPVVIFEDDELCSSFRKSGCSASTCMTTGQPCWTRNQQYCGCHSQNYAF